MSLLLLLKDIKFLYNIKHMKKKLNYLLILSIVTISGCSSSPISNDSTSDNSSNNEQVIYTNVYDYLSYLKNNNNYSMDVTFSNETYHHYVTPTYFYKEYTSTYPCGYILSNDGIYKVEYYDNVLTPYELYLDSNGNTSKDLYGNKLITTFNDFDLSKISDTTSRSISISNKLNKLSIFNIVDISTSYYINLKDMNISILDDNTLSIDINFNSTYDELTSTTTSIPSYNIHIYDIGVAHYAPIDEYISSGKSYFVPNDNLSNFRRLMYLNNYTREYYDDSYSTTSLAGKEIFTNRYYYVDYEDDYLKQQTSLYEIGCIGLKDYIYQNVNYTGVYYFTLSTLPYLTERPINESYDIPSVMNYPSQLGILTHLQFLETNGGDNYYICYESDMILDFIDNFNLSDSLVQIGATNVLSFEISLDLKEKDEDSKVVFTLNYQVGSKIYHEDYIYTTFDNTYIFEVDEWITNNNQF